MKIIKYSKKYADIFKIKEDQFKKNQSNLNSRISINRLYAQNIKRSKCKNCSSKKIRKFIKSFGIKYYICSNCGHLNGEFKDTKKFTNQIYYNDGGKNYSKNYIKDFNLRVKNIYSPKVNFLDSVIKKQKRVLDIGSGGGHFLKALEIKNIYAKGIEPNKNLVNLANQNLKKNKVILSNMQEAYKILNKEKKFNILSMIGVLEHLEDPDKILISFKKSHFKYLYLSLPVFSLSVFIENSFKNVFPRHLSGGHTHLYTEKSINYLKKKYKLKSIGEWWFGVDMADLFRSMINSANILDKKLYLEELDDKFFKHINIFQNILDKNKICSEVHIILSK